MAARFCRCVVAAALLVRAHGFSLAHGDEEPEASVESILATARRWSAPPFVGSAEGLGGGITYAYTRTFCETMLPLFPELYRRGTFFSDLRPGCELIEAAMRSAMDSWAANHPHVGFTHDASACARAGDDQCASTELLIGAFGASGATKTAEEAARTASDGTAAYTQVLNYSVGEAATFLPRAPDGSAPRVASLVIGSAHLNFNATECWYLDMSFCARWTGGNPREQGGSSKYEAVVFAVGLFAWLLCCGGSVRLLWQLLLLCCHTFEAPAWREQLPASVFERWGRRERAVHVARTFRVELIALCAAGLLGLPMGWRVLAPCFQCLPFESVAAHELGHVLGLDHPTSEPALRLVAPSHGSREKLACARDLRDVLRAGPGTSAVQEGGGGGTAGGGSGAAPLARTSIMRSVARPRLTACISQDDLDALNCLYPTCSAAANLGPPLCPRSDPPPGAARLLAATLLPLFGCGALAGLGVGVALCRARTVERAVQRYLDWRLSGEDGAARSRPNSGTLRDLAMRFPPAIGVLRPSGGSSGSDRDGAEGGRAEPKPLSSRSRGSPSDSQRTSWMEMARRRSSTERPPSRQPSVSNGSWRARGVSRSFSGRPSAAASALAAVRDVAARCRSSTAEPSPAEPDDGDDPVSEAWPATSFPEQGSPSCVVGLSGKRESFVARLQSLNPVSRSPAPSARTARSSTKPLLEPHAQSLDAQLPTELGAAQDDAQDSSSDDEENGRSVLAGCSAAAAHAGPGSPVVQTPSRAERSPPDADGDDADRSLRA